jgi:hypothetical protein
MAARVTGACRVTPDGPERVRELTAAVFLPCFSISTRQTIAAGLGWSHSPSQHLLQKSGCFPRWAEGRLNSRHAGLFGQFGPKAWSRRTSRQCSLPISHGHPPRAPSSPTRVCFHGGFVRFLPLITPPASSDSAGREATDVHGRPRTHLHYQ